MMIGYSLPKQAANLEKNVQTPNKNVIFALISQKFMPILEKIVISDFRNIQLQELEFSPNVNCVSGNNGEGKTNLLDAIYYLSMTKSAFASSDKFNFRHGTDEFSIAGTYRMENGLSSRFALKMSSKGEKKVKRDDKPYGKV